jgi:sulfoxide reductase catalytic subunit YedY
MAARADERQRERRFIRSNIPANGVERSKHLDQAEFWDPTTQEKEKDISPHHWPNHHELPNSPEYNALLAGNFEGYRLRIGGLVENPVELSYAELKAMPKQSQITTHFCIQGWSGVGKWAGVPMRHILDIVKPTKEARYVAFYSYSGGPYGGIATGSTICITS